MRKKPTMYRKAAVLVDNPRSQSLSGVGRGMKIMLLARPMMTMMSVAKKGRNSIEFKLKNLPFFLPLTPTVRS